MDWGSIIQAALPTAINTAAMLFSDAAGMGQSWTSTQEGAEYAAQQAAALQAAQIEAQKQMQAEALASAMAQQKISSGISGLSSGFGTLTGANTDLTTNAMRDMRGFPEVLQAAGANVVEALLKKGELAQRGFGDMASVLASYARR